MGVMGRDLPLYSRYTYRLHLRAVALDGAMLGIFSLIDVILRKALGASKIEIALYVMLGPVAALASSAFANLMAGRPRRPLFLGAAIVGRLALGAGALVASPAGVLALVALHALASAAVIPLLNTIYQANYPAKVRGRVVGLAMAVQTAAEIGAALTAGALLEWDARAYRVLLPVAGVLGFFAMLTYGRIRLRGERRRFRRAGLAAAAPTFGLVRSFREAFALLRAEPGFRRFETAFVTYGLGFFVMMAVIPIYLVDVLRATYVEAAVAKSLCFGVARILCLPLSGRYVDRVGPVKAGVAIFAFLALFPATLALSRSMWPAYAAFAVFGAGMAGVSIIWSLGSIHFAGDRDSSIYQGVHVTLIGVRGTFGPLIGYLAMTFAGPRLAMAIACAALLGAAGLLAAQPGRRRSSSFL